MSHFIENRQRVTDTSPVLVFLEMTSPRFPEPLRIVRYRKDIISNGVLFQACPFRFKLPDDAPGQISRTQLVLDNVGRDITADLEQLQPRDRVRMRMMITDTDNVDSYERVINSYLTNIRVDAATATADCGMGLILRMPAMRLIYDDITAPGVH